LVPAQYRAIELRPTFIEPDPIGQAGDQLFWSIAVLRRLLHDLQESSLQGGCTDGMLGDEPGRAATLQPDDRDAGPTVFVDNLSQPLGVFPVNVLHLFGVVAVESSCVEKMRPRIDVALCHCEQLVTQPLIHVLLSADRNVGRRSDDSARCALTSHATY